MKDMPITDLVFNAIEEVLQKYPKKTVKAEKFCLEYGLDYISELTDDIAMQLLEMLDSRTYIDVYRERKRLADDEHRSGLRVAINDFIITHPKRYMLIEKTVDSFLILKKNKFVIKNANNNNVFHEYVKETDTELLVVYIIHAVEPDLTEYMSKLLSMGCKQLTVYNTCDLSAMIDELI